MSVHSVLLVALCLFVSQAHGGRLAELFAGLGAYRPGGFPAPARLAPPPATTGLAAHIAEAERRFLVPAALIAAVIAQESAGNPRARAPDTSAKGLMQTIDATFAQARAVLAGRGIHIRDPFVPRDSVLAGSWYLSHCFELARRDGVGGQNRQNLAHWRHALEYYYAGPSLGRRPEAMVQVSRGGRTVSVNKARYARQVLKRAGA